MTPAEGWRRHVPDVTDEEIAALLPIVRDGTGRLRALVLAYRAGKAATRRGARNERGRAA